MTIPFVDLKCKSPNVRREISAAVERAIDDGQFILGDQVAAFEHSFAGFCGGRYGIGLGNGTEALHLALRALGIGPGDEVITAANTFVATALAIAYTGATPVLVDVDPVDYLIDVELIERAITPRTRAIVPVHLYGQPADMPAILEIAARYDLPVVQDACQAHGAQIGGKSLAANRWRHSAPRPATASTRARISARTATAAWSSRIAIRWPNAFECSATTGSGRRISTKC